MRSKLDLKIYEKKLEEAKKTLEEKKEELALAIGKDLVHKYEFFSWEDYESWLRAIDNTKKQEQHDLSKSSDL